MRMRTHRPLLLLLLLPAACHFSALPAPPDAKDATLAERADRVAHDVARIRALELKTSVPVAEQDKAGLRDRMAEEIGKEWDQGGAYEERAYKLFGLLPQDLDLREYMADFLKDQVAGYYDPEQGNFFTISDRDSKQDEDGDSEDGEDSESDSEADREGQQFEEQFLLAHELTHAVDDQHFELDVLQQKLESNGDASAAFTALVEGTAMHGGADQILDRAGLPASTVTPLGRGVVSLMTSIDPSELDTDVGEVSAKQLGDAPPIVSKSLISPYFDGFSFTNAIRSQFGWAGIDRAYADPPESTEQILFPERYIDRRDRPVGIALAAPPAGWKQLHDDTLGMLGMRVLLEPLDRFAASVADGWDGDRFALYETPAGDALGWVTVWDRKGDAEDFEATYRALLERTEVAPASYSVVRRGDVVAAVQGATEGGAADFAARLAAESALSRAPDDQVPERAYWKWLRFPLAFRVLDQAWETHALGGFAFDYRNTDGGHRFTLLDGLLLNSESTPDRVGFWLGLGLLGFASDDDLDYTFWRVPLLASGHYRGEGKDRRSRWSMGLRAIDWCRTGENVHFDLLWSILLDLNFGPDADDDGFSGRLFIIPLG